MSYPAETHDGEVTSWIPLTTSFTAPKSCSLLFLVEGGSLVAFDPVWGASIDPNVICQPPAVSTWWLQADIFAQNGLGDVHTAYSLLPFQCPGGFQTGASSIISTGASSTTLAFCCPSGYSVANQGAGTNFGNCESDVTPGQVATYVQSTGSRYATITTTFDQSSAVGAIAVQGYALSSLPSSTSSPSSSPDSSSNAGTSSPIATTPVATSLAGDGASSTATALSYTSSTTPEAGLSTGAKAGIGIGAAFGFLFMIGLIAAIVVIWRRVNAQSANRTTATSENIYAGPTPGEKEGGVGGGGRVGEKDGDQAQKYQNPNAWSELSGDRDPRELESRPAPFELEGSSDIRARQYI